MTEDNWLRMRDTGSLDEEGFLTVLGRCSDTVKLDTEEMVLVTPIEQRVRLELACVAQCVIVTSPARDSLGLIITLDTIADTNNTLNLSQSAVNWFKHARFDVKTVTDVVSNMENGLKHVIQAGIDRYNLSTVDRSHCISQWELKHLPFSVANAEIGLNGKVSRAVIVQRYISHIERMFNHHVAPRKTSRELTYIEEEEEISTPDIKVTRLKKSSEEVSEDKAESDSNDKNVTVVRLGKLDIESGDIIDNASEENVTNVTTKDSHDKHRVRFTANVEQIDYHDQEGDNEKTS